jgi:TolB protein
LVVIFLILIGISTIGHAQTEVDLGIKSTFATRIPLWIDVFSAEGPDSKNYSQELGRLILADMEFSGLFNVQRGIPSSQGDNENTLRVVIRGTVASDGTDHTFEGRVIDASTGQMIGGKKYRLSNDMIRRIAHHFSDEVVRMLTGEKGIASTKILFVRKKEERWELVMADYDGYGPKVLLRLGQPIMDPRWINERKAFAYTGYLHGKPDLFIRNLDEASSRPLSAYPGLNYSIDWSERRKELLVTLSKDGNPEIYIMDTKGRIKKRLTYGRAIDCGPSWSPDGREVVFTSDRSGSPQLYIMEADGSNVRRLTFYGNYSASAHWSPKGDLIAFVSRINGFFELCAIKPDGSGLRVISNEQVNHDSPRWAADGRHIVFTKDGGSRSLISIVDITTSGKRILCQGNSPDWSLE